MFQNLLDSLSAEALHTPMFVYYLQRHIQLDAGSHGPAIEGFLEILHLAINREEIFLQKKKKHQLL